MPNHVRNIIKMEGIEKLSLIKVNDEGEKFFDFNALIPMPESLNKCLHKDESGNWARNECEECDGCD